VERAARLRAELRLQRAQAAPHRQLPAMLVHHADVHEQVRRHHVELEIGALHVEARRIAHALQQRIGERAMGPGVRLHQFAGQPRGRFGSGTKRERGFCGRLFSRACTLSFSMPGTSHSVRSSLTWFSMNSGTDTVSPSRGSPGSCR
jgi:hypothetical protein